MSFHSLRHMHSLVCDDTQVKELWERVIDKMVNGVALNYQVKLNLQDILTDDMSRAAHCTARAIDGYRYESDYPHA